MAIVAPLSPAHAEQLEQQRAWVRNHYELAAQHQFDSVPGKLRVIHVILQNGWVAAEDTWKLQSLGIVFGDALAERLGLSWVTVKDEYGEDPALQLPGTTLLLFPMTSISKRVENGEQVDVFELYEEACGTVQQVRTTADADHREPGSNA